MLIYMLFIVEMLILDIIRFISNFLAWKWVSFFYIYLHLLLLVGSYSKINVAVYSYETNFINVTLQNRDRSELPLSRIVLYFFDIWFSSIQSSTRFHICNGHMPKVEAVISILPYHVNQFFF